MNEEEPTIIISFRRCLFSDLRTTDVERLSFTCLIYCIGTYVNLFKSVIIFYLPVATAHSFRENTMMDDMPIQYSYISRGGD